MLRSERESILESIGEVNAITEMQKQIHELKFEIDLEEGKPYRKEDPTERERDALYQEIRKALS